MLARTCEEGHLDLVDLMRVLRRRGEFDLLVEGQLLAGAADVPVFQIGGLEAEAELPERLQDRFLGG